MSEKCITCNSNGNIWLLIYLFFIRLIISAFVDVLDVLGTKKPKIILAT